MVCEKEKKNSIKYKQMTDLFYRRKTCIYVETNNM